jgi:hypothetical protein
MAEEYVKLTIRIKKKLLKEMKQAALDADSTVTDLTEKAFNDFLAKRKAK